MHTAEDGERGLEVARRINPSAILVDFVMPKMNGHMFCKMLRANESTKDTPVILISSKGEVVGQAFEEQFGIMHYFTKPFEPEELVQKLKDVLKATQRPALPQDAKVAQPARDAAALSIELIETFQERFDKTIRQYFQKDFPLLIKNVLSDTLKETGLVKNDTLVFSGDLSKIPLPDVLNFIYNSRLSGRLTVFSQAIFGEIFLENGMFAFATVSQKGSHQFLTDLMCTDGKVGERMMLEVVEEARERNLPVGRMLVTKGVLTEQELSDYLKRHAQDAFNGILDVRQGQFFMEQDALPLNLQDINFRIPLITVLMDGLRQLDEKQLAVTEFADESVVLVRLITNEDVLESYNFSETELQVFSVIDGHKALREIIQTTGLDPLVTKQICYSLRKVGLLRVKNV